MKKEQQEIKRCWCGGKTWKKNMRVNNEYEIYECLNCGIFATTPPPYDDEAGSEEYRDENLHELYNTANNEWLAYGALNIHILEKYIDDLDGKYILDIGCGGGHTLEIARREGMIPFGIELNHNRVKYVQNTWGIENVFNQDIKGFAQHFDGTLDIVIMSHVLEHIADPIPFIKNVCRVMHKESICLVSVPNYDSAVRRVFRRKWNGLVVNQHIWHFNSHSLSKLLDKGGLEVIGTEYHQLGEMAFRDKKKWKIDYNVMQFPFNIIPGKKRLWGLLDNTVYADQLFMIAKLKRF